MACIQTMEALEPVKGMVGRHAMGGVAGDGCLSGMVDYACQVLPCRALPCPALPCAALPCPALPCPALPCPALPCPALPGPALHMQSEELICGDNLCRLAASLEDLLALLDWSFVIALHLLLGKEGK